MYRLTLGWLLSLPRYSAVRGEPTLKGSKLLQIAFRHFRSRRMRMFEKTFAIGTQTRVLDVGGSPGIWEYATVHPQLTMINLPTAIERNGPEIQHVAGDGCQLPFPDKSFDIVFSNSVIEHVGTAQNQQRFASEIARVGRRYWVQTPDRRSPVEMHVMLPFVHYLPKRWQRAIIHRFTIWELVVRPSEEHKRYLYDHIVDELRLLDARDLSALFPDSRIRKERVLGVPKSLIALRT